MNTLSLLAYVNTYKGLYYICMHVYRILKKTLSTNQASTVYTRKLSLPNTLNFQGNYLAPYQGICLRFNVSKVSAHLIFLLTYENITVKAGSE